MSPLFAVLLWNTLLAGGLASLIFVAQRLRWLRCHPRLWHSLWLLVLLKLVIPPAYSIPVGLRPPAQDHQQINESNLPLLLEYEPRSEPLNDPAEVSPTTIWSFTWFALATCLSGTIWLLVRSLVRIRKISRLVRLAKPGPPWMRNMAARLAKEIGIRRAVSLLCVDGCVSPFLWVTRTGPVVVVPSKLAAHMEKESLRLIVRHELSHYARRDHWTNAFSMAVVALLWWNPVAWWARRELRFVQELCCDAVVLESEIRHRRRYAETLLQTVDFVASQDAVHPVPATAFGSCKTFTRRIEMISRRDLSGRMSYAARLLVLPLGALLIAASPTFAHDEDREDELSRMRGEIRELRAAVNELQSALTRLTREGVARRPDRDRRDDRLTHDRLGIMAERADLNEDERGVLYRLAEMVDGNPRQFERLFHSDDLNDTQMRVLRKLARDREDDDDRRERKIVRLTRDRLNNMAERADLNEDELGVLYRLAEMVDFNARQFEGLPRSDDLNDTQYRVLRKLARDRDDDDDRRERKIVRLTRDRLGIMAERADLNEDELGVLYRLAEMVDFNARQFEGLLSRDNLNDTQYRVLRKLARDRDDDDDRREDHEERRR